MGHLQNSTSINISIIQKFDSSNQILVLDMSKSPWPVFLSTLLWISLIWLFCLFVGQHTFISANTYLPKNNIHFLNMIFLESRMLQFVYSKLDEQQNGDLILSLFIGRDGNRSNLSWMKLYVINSWIPNSSSFKSTNGVTNFQVPFKIVLYLSSSNWFDPIGYIFWKWESGGNGGRTKVSKY